MTPQVKQINTPVITVPPAVQQRSQELADKYYSELQSMGKLGAIPLNIAQPVPVGAFQNFKAYIRKIRDKIPYIEHTDSKLMRQQTFKDFPFTKEAMDKITTKGVLHNYYRPNSQDYSEENPEKFLGISTTRDTVDIKDEFTSAVVAHEFVHVMQDQTNFNKVADNFNKDWESVKGNKMMKTIDMMLNSDPNYADETSKEDIAAERMAYLAQFAGQKGLHNLPVELRRYYRGIFTPTELGTR